jgi:hypothetical protein
VFIFAAKRHHKFKGVEAEKNVEVKEEYEMKVEEE